MTLSGPPRKIRVELIDPKTGGALRARDSAGKPIRATVLVQEGGNLDRAAGRP
jgi:hypothetical protein